MRMQMARASTPAHFDTFQIHANDACFSTPPAVAPFTYPLQVKRPVSWKVPLGCMCCGTRIRSLQEVVKSYKTILGKSQAQEPYTIRCRVLFVGLDLF